MKHFLRAGVMAGIGASLCVTPQTAFGSDQPPWTEKAIVEDVDIADLARGQIQFPRFKSSEKPSFRQNSPV